MVFSSLSMPVIQKLNFVGTVVFYGLLYFCLPCLQGKAYGPQPALTPAEPALGIEGSIGFAEPQQPESRIPGGQFRVGLSANDKERQCGSVWCTGSWIRWHAAGGLPAFRGLLIAESPSILLGKLGFFYTPFHAQGLLTLHQPDDLRQSMLGNAYGLGSMLIGAKGYKSLYKLNLVTLQGSVVVGGEGGFVRSGFLQAPAAGLVVAASGSIDLFFLKGGVRLLGAVESHVNFLSVEKATAQPAFAGEAELAYYFFHKRIREENGKKFVAKDRGYVGFSTRVDYFPVLSPTFAAWQPNPGLSFYGGVFVRYTL